MIDPENLRRQLIEVWADLGEQASSQNHELMRACTLTLIAILDEEDQPEGRSETIAQLMRDHPSRAILIRLAPGQADLLEAGVHVLCWMPFGGRQQICSEQIVIQCSERTLGEVPAVVLPLIVPDLPVVVWCPSERARKSPAFPALGAPAGRIILDSFRSANPAEALQAIAEEGSRSHTLVADLSWTRLTRWRSLLAQVFENELYRRQLPYFGEVTVEYEGSDERRVPPTALLLAGWLVSRLRWEWEGAKTSEPGLRSLRFRNAERDCFLLFRRRPQDIWPGRLSAFALASHHEPAIHIAISRTGEACGQVLVEVAGQEPVMSCVSLPRSTELLLLREELHIHSPDDHFEQSLDCARRIAGSL
jgi:glucose-6-phosphate dehydrogenase assembly protein OpcA